MSYFKSYANSFQEKSRLGLEAVSLLMEKLGNPQEKLNIVHVAGTNGKGSVCAFLQSIFTASGKKTGKYTSPNMIELYERINVNGENIAPKDMDRLLNRVQSACEEIEKEKGAMPTQFEIWTAVAFVYFAEKNCDIVVLETGLGGRLDATNVITKPLCSVISRIGIDHTQYLGNTIEKIAFEKACIIKENSRAVTLYDQSAMDVFAQKAKEMHADLILTKPVRNIRYKELSTIFDYSGMENIIINMSGDYQSENASLAIEAARALGESEEHIRKGLANAKNIGRFEKIAENPTVIFDGAHNENGIKAFVKTLERGFGNIKKAFIFASMADKDISANIAVIKKAGFDKFPFYTVGVQCNPRSSTAQDLADKFRANGFNATACHSISDAFAKASANAQAVFVFGSLYLYKDIYDSNLIEKMP